MDTVRYRCLVGAVFTSAALMIVGAVALAGHRVDRGPAKITVKTPGSTKKPPVTFDHAMHQDRVRSGATCKTCHHNPEARRDCLSCHGKPANEKTPELKDALHKRCKGCHKKIATEKPNAPTSCDGCHKK